MPGNEDATRLNNCITNKHIVHTTSITKQSISLEIARVYISPKV